MLQRSKPKCGSYMREVLLAQVSDFLKSSVAGMLRKLGHQHLFR